MSCLLRNAKRCKSLLSQGLNEYLLIKSLDACVVHAVDIDKGPSLRGLTATSVAVSQLASFRSFNSIATPAGQRNGIDSEKLRHRRHDISFSSASNYIVRRVSVHACVCVNVNVSVFLRGGGEGARGAVYFT